jgi:DNA-binding beta-propeller fold protein YncE
MRLVIGIAVLAAATFQTPAGPLVAVQSIELPHVEGRIDHLGYDSAGQRLFVAALGNNTVEVIDLKKGAVLRSVTGFREPQGIAFVPDLNLFAVANGQGDGAQLVSGADFSMGRAVALGDDSDNVRYDATRKRLYVGYGTGAIAAFNPADGKVAGQAKLTGHPESFQLERGGPRMFVNVPSSESLVVIDREAMKVVATWKVTGARANYPMALDETNHRVFIGCRRPAKVLVYDTEAGRESGSFDIVGDTDDLFYDAKRQRLYVSGGDGFVDAFDVRPGTPPSRLAHLPTAAGARTSLFVPDLNRLYLAVPHRGSQRAEIRVFEIKD